VDNANTGPEVWRSPTGDGGSWQKAVDTGFGSGRSAAVRWDNVAAVFKDSLYVGTFTQGNGGGRVWHKALTARFTASPTSGVAPLTVAFTNLSTGDYDASLWDFGDGLTGTVESPVHSYRTGGVYTVALEISGPFGSDTEVKGRHVTVQHGVYLPLVVRDH
jgi:PKD repeat protein